MSDITPVDRAAGVVERFQEAGHPYYDELLEMIETAIKQAVEADNRALVEQLRLANIDWMNTDGEANNLRDERNAMERRAISAEDDWNAAERRAIALREGLTEALGGIDRLIIGSAEQYELRADLLARLRPLVAVTE